MRIALVPILVLMALLGGLLASGAAAAQSAGRTAGEVIDDTTVALRVKAKLVADRPANLTRIDVRVRHGVVYLSGEVDSPKERARAANLAADTGGVREVVNDIRVKGQV